MLTTEVNLHCCLLFVGCILHTQFLSLSLSQEHYYSSFMGVGSETMSGTITSDSEHLYAPCYVPCALPSAFT